MRTGAILGALAAAVLGLAGAALWIELLFVPAITLIVLLAMVAESKKEHAPVAVFLRVVQSVVVLGLLSFVIWKAVEDRQAFLSLETLKDVALPVALSVSFVPFLYAMALFIAYDSVFRLFGWRIAEPRLRRYARRRTLVTCHLRLRPLGELVRVASRTRFDSREAVDDVLRKCQVPAPA